MRQDFEFATIYHDLIKSEYFSDIVLAWFFNRIRDHFLDYNTLIDEVSLRNEMLKAARAKTIKPAELDAYSECFNKINQQVQDKQYIADEVLKFCRHQAIKRAVLDLPSVLADNDFVEIEDRMNKAMSVGKTVFDIGDSYFTSWSSRIIERRKRMDVSVIPTGITQLDHFIGGGLKDKQLGIWMGPPNRGKSLALMQCAKRAIIGGKKVIHYTLEMGTEDVEDRYDSSFTRIPIRELTDQEDMLAHKMMDLGKRWGGSLIVKEFIDERASVTTLRAHVNRCVQQGFVPDLIVVDYLDLLSPPRKRKEKREELSDITSELRALSKALLIPIWTATQSNRAAISLETHTEEQVAEDIGKIAIADVVITINQTKDEVATGIMRLFLAKNRNGPKYLETRIQTELKRMCFYDPMMS